jgi:hypothetical protein
LPKGKYTICISSDDGKAVTENEINLTNDKWIFISYPYVPPIDAPHADVLLKNFRNDTAWVNPQVRGFPPTVTIHIMDKEPVHM